MLRHQVLLLIIVCVALMSFSSLAESAVGGNSIADTEATSAPESANECPSQATVESPCPCYATQKYPVITNSSRGLRFLTSARCYEDLLRRFEKRYADFDRQRDRILDDRRGRLVRDDADFRRLPERDARLIYLKPHERWTMEEDDGGSSMKKFSKFLDVTATILEVYCPREHDSKFRDCRHSPFKGTIDAQCSADDTHPEPGNERIHATNGQSPPPSPCACKGTVIRYAICNSLCRRPIDVTVPCFDDLLGAFETRFGAAFDRHRDRILIVREDFRKERPLCVADEKTFRTLPSDTVFAFQTPDHSPRGMEAATCYDLGEYLCYLRGVVPAAINFVDALRGWKATESGLKNVLEEAGKGLSGLQLNCPSLP